MSTSATAPWSGSYVALDQSVLDLATTAGLHHRAITTYVWLRRFRNRATDLCCPSQETLAERMGVSVRTVRNAVADLVRWGFVTIERRRRPGTGNLGVNRYHFPTAERIKAKIESLLSGLVAATECAVEAVTAVASEIKKGVVMSIGEARAKLRKVREAAEAKTAAAAQKRAEKKSAPKPSDDDGAPEKVKPMNSSDVRRWFEEAREEHWPDLPVLPPWTTKDQVNAKRLLEVYKAETLRRMVFQVWRNREAYGVTGVPGPGLVWAMQSRLYGEVISGVEDVASKRAPGYTSRAERINRDEWTKKDGARGVLSAEDLLADIGE